MKYPSTRFLQRIKTLMSQAVFGPAALAFLPALTLGTFWLGGEVALIAAALGLPVLVVVLPHLLRNGGSGGPKQLTDLPGLDRFKGASADTFEQTRDNTMKSAMLMLEIDEFDDFLDLHGSAAADAVLQRCGDRIVSTLRQRDVVARIDKNRFAVCLHPVLQLDLELAIQMAGRLQAALEEPISIDGTSVFITTSTGICLRHRAPGDTVEDWQSATEAALQEAKAVGPAGVRVFSGAATSQSTGKDLRAEVAQALDSGMIQAWFQPQVCTDTGRVSGFEALARWAHPVKGLVPPSTFLPALEESGLMQKLSCHMVTQSLTALKSWDAAGLDVPCVGVNFATDELRDPGLVDRIRNELDRFDLTPDRLSVEILETVMTDQPDDMITRNITALGELGCRIDLDDFGTGHASIASVRRFRVSRIKIDRSFVAKADHDPDQQKLIAAILTMAERLDLDTLAEGVETVGEHALLAQLGCGHVQGFGIGRPMPFDQTIDWTVAHEAKLQDAPAIGSRSS